MTTERIRKKNRERQARDRQRKLDKGLQQINAWLDEQTIKRLNELAKDSSRTAVLKKAIDKLYEEIQMDADSGKYTDDSGFGNWS